MSAPHFSCLLVADAYKPGDPPPSGYLAWHEWARAQLRAGYRQTYCVCGKWHFQQEPCWQEKGHAPSVIYPGRPRRKR